LLSFLLLAPRLPARAVEGRVTLVRTPGEGIQPQAVRDAEGVVHLVYYHGDPARGDLFYTRTSGPGSVEFAPPVRVNSQPGSAVAMGTIRGGQIALGRQGRVHVAWNGSTSARPSNPIKGVPMLYARLEAGRTAFEPQRNLMQRTFGLDGGGSVAADHEGNVYVAWHGKAPDAPEGEAGRRLWVAHSTDDGATFAPEEAPFPRQTGACGCCGTRALVDARGTVYALYRAAQGQGGSERDMMLVWSRDRGAHFQGTSLAPWRIAACPMSSESLVETPSGVLAAWETQGKVAFARIDPESQTVAPPVAPPGGGDRKHPALAVNARGETILVWAEGTGWQRGGTLAWRIFDPTGRPTREAGRVEGGIPVWSFAAVVARPDGGFTIYH
jgi:hypothetical protein